jgi:hypothetical protein
MKKLIYWGLKIFIFPILPILPGIADSISLDVKSPGFLDYLSKDKDSDIRFWVALNRNTSPETLDYLSKDKDSDVRCAVVFNSNTSQETLKQMSIVEEKDLIKYRIKIHPNCSLETYKYLSALEILKTLQS